MFTKSKIFKAKKISWISFGLLHGGGQLINASMSRYISTVNLIYQKLNQMKASKNVKLDYNIFCFVNFYLTRQVWKIEDMYKKGFIFMEIPNIWIYYYTTNINGLLNSSFRLDGWFFVRISDIFGNGKWLHFKIKITPTLNYLHPIQGHRIGHYITMTSGLLNPSFWLDWGTRSLKNEKWMRFQIMVIKA